MRQMANFEKITETMTLDEAIKHCQEIECNNEVCKLEHKQLAAWLIELKEFRKKKELFKNLPYLKK